jgi:hypothetical protein
MGLIPTFCRALILLHKRVGLQGPLLTLGNQDVWASYDQLKSFFREMECDYHAATPLPHTSRLFRQRPEAEDFVHARTFFEMMGIKEYYDIDKFDIDSPLIMHDLNAPVPADLQDRFNLILDSGTIEHIFDVRQVMENIVRMCRESGWVVHVTPSSNYVDHGFYSFSPCFFYDYYQANGFDDFICYVLQPDPDNVYQRSPYFEYSYGMNLSNLIEPGRQVLVFFAARKVRLAEQLVVPTQGLYEPGLEAQPPQAGAVAANGKGFVSITERFVPAFLIPLLKPVRPLLGAARKIFSRRAEDTASSRRLRKI